MTGSVTHEVIFFPIFFSHFQEDGEGNQCKTGKQGTGKAFVQCGVLSGVKVTVDKALDSLRNEVGQGGWQ